MHAIFYVSRTLFFLHAILLYVRIGISVLFAHAIGIRVGLLCCLCTSSHPCADDFSHLTENACCCVECISLFENDFSNACWALFAVCGRSLFFSAARHLLTDVCACNWLSVLFCSTQLPDLWFLLHFVADVKGRFLVVVMLVLA